MKFDWSIAATMGVILTLTLVTAAVGRHLKGAELAIFMALMVLLGIAAAAAIIFFKNRNKKPAAPPAGGAPSPSADPGGSSELDTLIHEADQRLAQANAGATTANLPLIFVIGDRSTAKTSIVVNSGIEPELMAGQVYQDNNIGPTRSANLWFTRGTAVVEAGGPILGDPTSWQRLLKKLQPGKMKSLKGGAQAPRAVLLCVSLEMFAQQGSPDALAGAARYLQARLGEVAQTLGIRFPVYILFTKTDRVPFFTEFVSTFTNEEASQIFGVTVPIRPPQTTGIYAEDETRRLTAYFDNLFFSLCDKRTVFPPRENDIQKVYGAYEFPREVRKLRDLMIRFMVDVCRPNQLMPTNPFLRGFYLTGVRPVVVSEAAPIMAAQQQQSDPKGVGGGATSIFRVGKQAEMLAQQGVAQAAPTSRKVPQWMFLGHLFSNIILGDSAALNASGSSVKVSALRRGLLIAAATTCLILGSIWTWSFFGNRALENQAQTAADHLDAKTVPTVDSYPSLGSLQELETLRSSLETLSIYKDDTPFSLRWGLYEGNNMLPAVKRLYFDRFKALLFGQTQDGLLKIMRTVKAPAGSDDDYNRPYYTLRAYLLTTDQFSRTKPVAGKDKPDTSMRDFLSSLLFARWKENRKGDLGKQGLDLAQKQFDYYALTLGSGYNPYSQENDVSVKNARAYLDSFKGPQRVYAGLLIDTNKIDKPLSFNQYSKDSDQVLISPHQVPFAFSKLGAKEMLDRIKNKDYGGEEWVLGKTAALSEDRATMQKLVTDLYAADYIKEWRTVLNTSRVVPFADLNGAAIKLDTLTGNTAPILGLLFWTSQNTFVDGVPGLKDAFRSVRSVEPPDADGFVKPALAYNVALSNLEAAIKAASPGKFVDADTMKAAKLAEATARQETKNITSLIPHDSEGHLDSVITELMVKPIPDIHPPSVFDELNKKGAGFCTSFGPITRKFPFDANSSVDATLADVADIFKPKDGQLWKFYNEGLNKVIQCTGGDCTVVPNVTGTVSPSFLSFFKQAVRLSRALYGDSGDTPSYKYTLTPHKSDQIDSFLIVINGDTAKLAGGESKGFIWPGSSSPSFNLSYNVSGGSTLGYGMQNYSNTLWAVFRFFADANQTAAQGSTYDFVWDFSTGKHGAAPIVNGKPLSFAFTVDTNGAPAVFSKEFLKNMKCIPTVGK